MTEAEKIAAGLTEAQREALLGDARGLKGHPRLERNGLLERVVIEKVATALVPVTRLTPLGLAVREALKPHHPPQQPPAAT
jgi:hypothetical protein